jgi:hypothetical protein
MHEHQLGDGEHLSPETSSASQSQTELVASTVPLSAIHERTAGLADIVADDEPFALRGQNGILSGNNTHSSPPSNLELDADDGGGHYTLVENGIDRVCVGEGSQSVPSYNWRGAFYDGKQEIVVELTELWNEIASNEGDLQLYERLLLLCELPFTVLRKVCKMFTIFFVENSQRNGETHYEHCIVGVFSRFLTYLHKLETCISSLIRRPQFLFLVRDTITGVLLRSQLPYLRFGSLTI